MDSDTPFGIADITPWFVDLEDAREINGMVFVAIKDKNHAPVAMVPVISMDGVDTPSKVHLDIARLIAAAPELLEAVKFARWHLMTKARKDPEERKVIEKLSEAYAKAAP